VSEADIQGLVESIAAELGAAVGLVDSEERLIAHSAHEDVPIDEVRRSGIMHRRLTPEVRAWFDQWEYRGAPRPVRTPSDKKLDILARWCVPVMFRGAHLAYLWILDAGKVAEDQLGSAIEAAEQIGALLYRRRLSAQLDSDLLRVLLIPNPENAAAAAEVRAVGTYVHMGPIAVVIAGAPDSEVLAPGTISDLSLAVQRTAEQAPPGTVLAGVVSDVGVLLAPLRSQGDLDPAKRLAEKVRHLAAHVNDTLRVVAAIGGAAELERTSRSYAEARRTLSMMRAMPDLGPVVAWDELGVFRALALVPQEEAENGVIDARVRDLLTNKGLAATAETFLDLAGDVQETAARLYVHRTTLYQRLDRIGALYNLDLRRSGDHRLITHLGLKLARLARP
jgi:hypothetical protein